MERVNLNFHGFSNCIRSICWILSVLSWLLLIVVGWIGLISFDSEKIIWTIQSIQFKFLPTTVMIVNILSYYIPFLMTEEIIYIVFIILMILITAGFVLYIIYAIFMKDKPDIGIFNGMMGSVSKFHFIPFICASALFLIGLSYNDYNSQKGLIIASICFSFVGFVCLTIIYLTTKLNSPWYINCVIKKGAFSCLITLFVYNLLINIINLGVYAEMDRVEKMDIIEVGIWLKNYGESSFMDFMKSCRIAIPLTMGIFNLSLAFGLKDVFIPFMNFLIYLGCILAYYNIDDDTKKLYDISNGEAIIDIIFSILSIAVIVPLVILYKKRVLE